MSWPSCRSSEAQQEVVPDQHEHKRGGTADKNLCCSVVSNGGNKVVRQPLQSKVSLAPFAVNMRSKLIFTVRMEMIAHQGELSISGQCRWKTNARFALHVIVLSYIIWSHARSTRGRHWLHAPSGTHGLINIIGVLQTRRLRPWPFIGPGELMISVGNARNTRDTSGESST